jgi:NADH-quinone oxidoreductase subunit M
MILALLQLLPLLGALALALARRWPGSTAVRFATLWSLLPLGLVLVMAWQSRANPAVVSAGWDWPWLPEAGMVLRFSADGVSLGFLLLTALVVSFSLFMAARIGPASRGFAALVLITEAMLFGVFTARHFVPWFLCWEGTLIPAYLLVRLWGGPKAAGAAMRFFMITLAGSLAMLAGFLVLQKATGTMDFAALADLAAQDKLAPMVATTLGFAATPGIIVLAWIAALVFLGLAVKLPVVPFHAWLPAAYAEAPAPATMILTGALSKMAVHGLVVVFLPVFRECLPLLAPLLWALALWTVLHGAFAAMAQTDMKRMLAYSSVNHLGYCLLAAAALAEANLGASGRAAAVSGILLQGFNHGIIAATLFACAGFLENRAGHRDEAGFGGLRSALPVLAGFTGLAAFASLGLPALGGFVGEFLIFRAVFEAFPWAAVAAVPALFVTALFLLRWKSKVFHGPVGPTAAKWNDLRPVEITVLSVAAFFIILPGVWPQSLLHWFQTCFLLASP